MKSITEKTTSVMFYNIKLPLTSKWISANIGTLQVQWFKLCSVELWHLVNGNDNKLPQLHATQSEPLD